MLHTIIHVLIDTLKIIPFLLVAFLIIEFVEHKISAKGQEKLLNGQKYGPLFGGVLGMIPQCGFSAFATNLFSSRFITIGTLVAVYLSTSDEMLPLLLSGGISIVKALEIVLIKACIGFTFGFLIDLLFKRHNARNMNQSSLKEIHNEEHHHCHKNIFWGALKHTLSITIYVFIASVAIDLLIDYVGEKAISNFMLQDNFLSYFIASLIGLIPNCASSVIITELYINNVISLGNLFSGVLTGAGVGILLLFKTNKHLKENFIIIGLIYFIGVFCGFIIDLLGIVL